MTVRMTPQDPQIATDSDHTGLDAGSSNLLNDRIIKLENQVRLLADENRRLNRQWQEATSSISWKLINKLNKTMRFIAPPGSWRRSMLKGTWRGLISARRHGPIAWARRTAAQLKSKTIQFKRQYVASKKQFVKDDRPLILAISHIGGGGTERHVRDMANRLISEGVRTIYTRPDQHGRLVFEERDSNWQVFWRRSIQPDSPKIMALLKVLKPSLAHVHHTMDVPESLFQSLQSISIPIDWTLHDYHSVCPRIHLHSQSGRYCGEPDEHGCQSCLKRQGDYHGRQVSLGIRDYRNQWADRLANARRVYVPSQDIKNRLNRYFPSLSIDVRPHMEPSRPDRLLAKQWLPGDPVRIAVIGTIGSIKGSSMLLAAARDAAERSLPIEFVLVGTSSLEPQLLATGRVELTGAYHENEIWDRLSDSACHLAWLPSIWPETYMYTLSVAQLAGLWPVVFDIGAQADRVRKAGAGEVLSLDSSPENINNLFLNRAAQLAELPAINPPEYAEYSNFLMDYYGLTQNQLKSFTQNITRVTETENQVSGQQTTSPHASRSDHARLHKHHSQLSA